MLPVRIAVAGREHNLAELDLPLEMSALLGPARRVRGWDVEIGFGKGRFLLEQARANPDRGYLGIEVASKYYRRVRDRAARDGCDNLILLRGEALYLLAAVLPARFAQRVHVYFPDPWPKSRHQGRRLFDPESLDLLLRLLEPGGSLVFATDFLEYGAVVGRLLRAHSALEVATPARAPDQPARTHYEEKYRREGRRIVRFEARLISGETLFHPQAERVVSVANARPAEVFEQEPASRS